jgi:acyl-CoA reductase-like NAD-dependent aldehyde dehydrogenase
MAESPHTESQAAASTAERRGPAGRLDVLKTYKIYVGGKFPRTESGRYYLLRDAEGRSLANLCRCSRKDLREAVAAARSAWPGWARTTAYLRGQILYRVAEMLEGRKAEFAAELRKGGVTRASAAREVQDAVDLLVYYAGWSDKYQQIFSSVNPVSGSYFNFSVLEPTGVVGLVCPEDSGLLGLAAQLAPAVVGGNTAVGLASYRLGHCAVAFGEVLQTSDVPAGVVNLLTGSRDELLPHFGSHMDINAVVYGGDDPVETSELESAAAGNVKRIVVRRANRPRDWKTGSPYAILDTQEVKTTWHPVGV